MILRSPPLSSLCARYHHNVNSPGALGSECMEDITVGGCQETAVSGLPREHVTLNYRKAPGALAMHTPARLLRAAHRDLGTQTFQGCAVSSRSQEL